MSYQCMYLDAKGEIHAAEYLIMPCLAGRDCAFRHKPVCAEHKPEEHSIGMLKKEYHA